MSIVSQYSTVSILHRYIRYYITVRSIGKEWQLTVFFQKSSVIFTRHCCYSRGRQCFATWRRRSACMDHTVEPICTAKHTNKYNLGIRHGRQRIVYAGSLRWHGEKCRDSQWNSSRHTFGVQPEADPGYDDQHAARGVELDHVVWELAFENEVHTKATVRTCAATKNSSFSLKLVLLPRS